MNSRKLKRRAARAQATRKQAPATVRRDSQRRVHLELYRDPVSGKTGVALKTPVFKEDWQNQITAAAANTAQAILGTEPTLRGAVELARNAMDATSRLADGLLAQAPAGTVACRAGCDHCCYQRVDVTAAETLAIFEQLKARLSDADWAQLKARVLDLYQRRRGLSSAERFSPDHPCVFLESGRCSVYEVRPLACRGMNSLDADECRTRLRDPEARAGFLASGVGGRSFMEPIRAFHAVSAGLQLALSELYALDMRPLELTAALHLLLNGSESIPEQWLQGESSFGPAHSPESPEDPGMQQLSGICDSPDKPQSPSGQGQCFEGASAISTKRKE